ncbi:HAMP domain-containing sensor histidine kinase [Streptomyces marispadix]|uniref:histidine kinase n=1 Tax=Streptomyces marispadix TaxID=2922868 RepID=A0ABS9SXT1_9ACTN|nr:HAMP domain-containing sensor histidine kinase [Streptomyces marispadix]MCH6161086.1 HAMP domain-containing histidine kinase [Streptomyces marispadix]
MARPRLPVPTLRSRLALLAAVTVALAVAACATACWFIVRAQLVGSLDQSLRSNSRVDPSFVVGQLSSGQCSPADERAPNPFDATVQVVDKHGKSCVIVGSRVEVTSGDERVAEHRRPEAVHTARSEDGSGTDYRVLTTPVEGTDVAVSVARPLTETDRSLRNLALILALVGGTGVLAAAGAGVVLARAGLRPVDRLTGAVEHIARTEDLGVSIPAEGDDEIARLSRSFNSMTEALASSRVLQQQLIADAGHELRTPLTSLRTNIELLVRAEESGRSLPGEDRRALLESVRAQMSELAALVGDLQELSREMPPGGGPVAGIALHEITRRAAERVRLRGGGITVAVRTEPWYVCGEPAALERAVVNLLDNAVKFSPDGGTVEAELTGGTLRVRDHGPGIADDELPYVFDRFWRSPSARSLPGSGLGLSIAARTARQAGGEVTLEAAEGGGTVAVLSLPGSPRPEPEAEEEAAGRPGRAPGPPGPPGPPGAPGAPPGGRRDA